MVLEPAAQGVDALADLVDDVGRDVLLGLVDAICVSWPPIEVSPPASLLCWVLAWSDTSVAGLAPQVAELAARLLR